MTTPNAHRWTASIDFNASPDQAQRAAEGRTVTVDPGVKVDCHMVRCTACHGRYEACHDQPCPGKPSRRLVL